MHPLDGWEVSSGEARHPVSAQVVALASAPQGPQTVPRELVVDLPVLANRASSHARVLTARGPPATRHSVADGVPTAFRDGVGTPMRLISRLNDPAYEDPYQRFADALTNANA
jgi:hypothetical protein